VLLAFHGCGRCLDKARIEREGVNPTLMPVTLEDPQHRKKTSSRLKNCGGVREVVRRGFVATENVSGITGEVIRIGTIDKAFCFIPVLFLLLKFIAISAIRSAWEHARLTRTAVRTNS